MQHWEPRSYSRFRAQLDAGARTVHDEIDTVLERIATHDPVIGAYLPDETANERSDRLHAEADALTRDWPDPENRPPLYGALVGVKDIFHTKDFPTRAGSRLPAEAFTRPGAPGNPDVPGSPAGSRADGDAVAAMRAAGALVVGKTVSTEFAYFGPGQTRNPWNTAHTPGGSSSGSGAAVGAGLAHITLGSQTIGSISRPAVFCGVSGFKPSFGRVSRAGVVPFSWDADHVGCLASDAASLAAGAQVLLGAPAHQTAGAAGSAPDSGSMSARGFTHAPAPSFLIPDDAYLEQADEHGRAALASCVDRLRSLGYVVRSVQVLDDIAGINQRHQALVARDFAEVHQFWVETFAELYHPRSKELIAAGLGVSDTLREEARASRTDLRERMEQTLERHAAHFWLAPGAVGEAPHGIDSTGDPVMNLPWTHAGLPTVAMPVTGLRRGVGPQALPLGIQIAAPHGHDGELLDLAQRLEPALARPAGQ